MNLGAFSISLAVKDLAASKTFYETLGFAEFGGNADHGFLIMKNAQTIIGLFQGMFEGNILTFNPGWDQSARPVDPFDDMRVLKARLMAAGLTVANEAGEATGPGSFMVTDPDGNQILVDQHR